VQNSFEFEATIGEVAVGGDAGAWEMVSHVQYYIIKFMYACLNTCIFNKKENCEESIPYSILSSQCSIFFENTCM